MSLTITESTIDGNTSAISGGGIFQGGTSNFPGGTTVIANTTIADNKASNSGGGIYNLDVLNVSNTTFAGNQAESVHGGGLYNGGGANTTLVHATITQNTANRRGGGFRNQGILSLERSLVAGNTAPTSPNIDGAFTDSNNLTSGNPVLAPLANYGGLTDTMPPLPGSLAIDSATTLPSTPATDQRGLPRPNGPAPDIGAAEAYPLSLATHPSNDGDTIPDILEGPDGAYPHLNPSANDSTTDTDGDGSPDQDEIGNMTDLFNPNDLFKILSLTVTNIHPTTGAITADLTWTTFPSLTYDILCNDSLDFSSATPLNPTPITPTTTTHTESIQLLPNQDYTTIRRN
ncbi:MAG: choice-of-anchor Q domain-containing protein [Verrucomicrobiota bacterium]